MPFTTSSCHVLVHVPALVLDPDVARGFCEVPGDTIEVIDAIWLQPASALPVPHAVLPDGCVDVILETAGEGALIFGPTTARVDVLLDPGVTYAGVRLQPWIGAPLLGRHGEELVDRVEPWPHDVPRLGATLDEALAAITSVATHLVDRMRWSPAQRLVRDAHTALGAASLLPTVAALARTLGVSVRTLRRAFDAVTGAGPKTALRIVRLHRALARIGTERLVEVAHDCGFADQAHLARELRTLAGLRGRNLQARAAAAALHVPA
jgi:AraC-like DNA-binding protein